MSNRPRDRSRRRPWSSARVHVSQASMFASPFDAMSRGEIYYGPVDATANVPPEVLANSPTYLDYVKASTDKGTGGACLMDGECCMDVQNQRAGSWKSCDGGCANAAKPELAVGGEARTDVEGCCWWGRGVIQTTGVCNFGKLNYFTGKKAPRSRPRCALEISRPRPSPRPRPRFSPICAGGAAWRRRAVPVRRFLCGPGRDLLARAHRATLGRWLLLLDL